MALRPNDANMSALFYFVRFFVDSETSATMSVRQLCIPYHAANAASGWRTST
jgi:hypothetical protein